LRGKKKLTLQMIFLFQINKYKSYENKLKKK